MARRRKRALRVIVLPYLRIASIVAGVSALVVALAVGAALLLFDPNSYKPEVEAAVKRATGRDFDIRGPIVLVFGLPPTLVLDDITLANRPGGKRAEMVTLQRVEIRLALLPLLFSEIDILQLSLYRPDVLLETDESGVGNWHFAPTKPLSDASAISGAGPSDASDDAVQPPPPRRQIALRSLRIRDLHVRWSNGATENSADWEFPRLDAEAEDIGHSMLMTGSMVSGGRPLTLSGELGALDRLLDASDERPWTLDATAKTEGFQFEARGTVLHPLQGVVYTIQLDASGSDVRPLAAFLPQPLPELADLTASAHISNAGGHGPVISGVGLHISEMLVPSFAPGVRFMRADLSAPAPDQPIHADVKLIANATPVHVLASIGTLSGIMPGAVLRDPLPVDFSIEAAEALLSLKGGVQNPATLSGLDLQLIVRIPNLANLGPLLRSEPPALRQIALDASIDGRLQPGGSIGLHRISLIMPQGDFVGELTVGLGPRPMVRGAVGARQMDLDSLLANLSPAPPPVPTLRQRPRLGAPLPEPKAPAVFSDQPFDLSALDLADADVKLVARAIRTGGVVYGNVIGRLKLQDGALALDPFTAESQAGRLDAMLMLDARNPDSPIALRLHVPYLALQPVGAASGDPEALSGAAFVDADLRGAGRSLHQVMAALDGHVGVGVADADIDNALVARLLGNVLRTARIPETLIGGIGRTKLRCGAARLDIAHGQATVAALAADALRWQLEGTGSMDLGAETFALRLRPTLRAAPGIAVPVNLDGRMLSPSVTLDTTAAARGLVAGALGSALGAGPKAAAPAVDICAAAFTAARGSEPPAPAPVAETPAPAPPPPSAAAPAAPAKLPKLIDLTPGGLR